MVSWISPEEGSSGGWKWRVETLPVLVDVEGEPVANLIKWLMNYPNWSTQVTLGKHQGDAHLNQWSSGNTLFRKSVDPRKLPRCTPWCSFEKSPAPMSSHLKKKIQWPTHEAQKKKQPSPPVPVPIPCGYSNCLLGQRGRKIPYHYNASAWNLSGKKDGWWVIIYVCAYIYIYIQYT